MDRNDLPIPSGQADFEVDDLRAFVAGVELGSFARAARRLGRSTSALSTRLRKLTDAAGRPLVVRVGRGFALTEAGEVLLGYARRILELEEEAAVALRGAELAGWARLGLQEDFGDLLLSGVLGQFTRAHPRVRVEARVGRNADLLERLAMGKLDMALVWGDPPGSADVERLAELRMRWIGRSGARLPETGPVPLVLFEPPCLFRTSATVALERTARSWRLAFTSPSLSGLWAAAGAGLGFTVRTELGVPAALHVFAPGDCHLPPLPSIALSLARAKDRSAPAALRLAELVREAVRAALVVSAPPPAPRPRPMRSTWARAERTSRRRPVPRTGPR